MRFRHDLFVYGATEMNANDCLPHFYPSPILSDRQWCRVVNALWEKNTKADSAIAQNLERQIAEKRRRVSTGPQ